MDALSRRQFLSLASAATVGVSAGCAGMGVSTSVKSGSGPIAFWSNHPGESSAVENELISRFEKQFPGLSAELIDAGAPHVRRGREREKRELPFTPGRLKMVRY